MTASALGLSDVCVVVLTYGRDGVHLPLVNRLIADGIAPEAILLVHNPQATGDAWRPAAPPGVRVEVLPENRGYAGGMNHGIGAHDGASLVLLLTHDARPEPGAVQTLIGALDRRPELGIVGPRLDVASTGALWSVGVRRDGGLTRHVKNLRDAGDGVALADAIDGTAMLVRREVLNHVGGFDERLFMYFEESDICLRATRAGWEVGVATDARAVTEPGAPKRHAAHAYFAARNGLEYARRAAGLGGLAQVLLRLVGQTYLSMPRPWTGDVPDGAATVFRLRLLGTTRGVLDFLLRRWGPPPPTIQRLSDISGTT